MLLLLLYYYYILIHYLLMSLSLVTIGIIIDNDAIINNCYQSMSYKSMNLYIIVSAPILLIINKIMFTYHSL